MEKAFVKKDLLNFLKKISVPAILYLLKQPRRKIV